MNREDWTVICGATVHEEQEPAFLLAQLQPPHSLWALQQLSGVFDSLVYQSLVFRVLILEIKIN